LFHPNFVGKIPFFLMVKALPILDTLQQRIFFVAAFVYIVTYPGWWYTYPSEKYDESSVGVMKFPTEWKNKNDVPNHQPDCLW